jgi:membrane fusion protein, multidrug efflux system
MPVLTFGRVFVLAAVGVVATGAGLHYTGRPVPAPLDKIPYGKVIPPYTVAEAKPATGAGGPRSAAPQRPPATIVTAVAERRPMPVRLEAIGTAQTISAVTVRTRVESQIMEVGFKDGDVVKKGDLLFRLDSRQLEASLRQAEANVARDRASLVSAEADLRRAEELAKREFATDQRLETARATAATLRASIRGGEAAVDGLKVQLTYYTITAPVSGRIGVAALKEGNIAKTGDNSGVLATINQIDPIYVSFALPQRHLPEIKAAMTAGTATVRATQQGVTEAAEGKIAVIDNLVDATTGTIQMRAIFDNAGETLWPGALCQVRITLRVEPDAMTVPREAVQNGQSGAFVFVIEDGIARPRPVVVDRSIDGRVVLASGLKGGEAVVVDGALLLTDGARTVERNHGGGAGGRPPGNLTSQRGSST